MCHMRSGGDRLHFRNILIRWTFWIHLVMGRWRQWPKNHLTKLMSIWTVTISFRANQLAFSGWESQLAMFAVRTSNFRCSYCQSLLLGWPIVLCHVANCRRLDFQPSPLTLPIATADVYKRHRPYVQFSSISKFQPHLPPTPSSVHSRSHFKYPRLSILETVW